MIDGKSGVGAAAVVSLVLAAGPRDAGACGCFAPPDVASPVVQAGEQIVFAQRDGKVVAHIQIQYSGPAAEFAWLLPLPSEPVLRLSTTELFAELDGRTRPQFQSTTTTVSCDSGGGGGFGGCGCSSDDAAFFASPGDFETEPPQAPQIVVTRATAGPYDYAVLRADSQAPLLSWLRANEYFVPAGTENVLERYIHPGAYFLALKLSSGRSSGDIRPVMVEYTSELPMIPIVLTSVGAVEDMPIQVFVLGDARAIPRNYAHVLPDFTRLEWSNGAANYLDLVGRAIDEAPEGHAFFTEWSGSTAQFLNRLDRAGRFGSKQWLLDAPSAAEFLRRLRIHDYPWDLVVPILQRWLPYPEAARARGISEAEYYAQIDVLLPQLDPTAMIATASVTAELQTEIVEPTMEAARLFHENTQVTRLLTVLSPHEMTEDPVFGFNPWLPEEPGLWSATITNECGGAVRVRTGPREHVFEDRKAYQDHLGAPGPYAARVEVLREAGPPEVLLENHPAAPASEELDEGGCTSGGRPARGGLGTLLFVVALISLRRFARIGAVDRR